MVEKVSLKVFRFNPSKDLKPSIVTYEVPAEGPTVLDLLLYAKERIDHSIALRYSCRMGICGSCAMIVNGSPMLSCQAQLRDLHTLKVEVKPIENLPIIRDLACDFTEFYSKHYDVKPYLIRRDRSEQESPKSEYLQSIQDIERYLQFALCIKCGLCFHACPIVATDEDYSGPQALSQAYRYLADSRDEDTLERIRAVDTRHGCWRCHLAESCSRACPKGVDPSLGIQLLRRLVTASRLGRRVSL